MTEHGRHAGRQDDQAEDAGRTDHPGAASDAHVHDQQHGAHHDGGDAGELESQSEVAEPDDRRLQLLVEESPVQVDRCQPQDDGGGGEDHQGAAALQKARIDSPRGPFTLSKSHNPVQDIYLRKVVGKENRVEGIAVKALADPGRGCRM